jgi:hypothetical protein
MRNVCKVSVGIHEGKRPLRRPIPRWVGNITMDLKEIGWEGIEWIQVAQDRGQGQALLNIIMKGREFD